MFQRWHKVAEAIQSDVERVGLASRYAQYMRSDRQSPIQRFDEIVNSPELIESSRRMFIDGYYATAVEKAFVCLNNKVKEKSLLDDRDGADLMRAAFSANSPVLALNPNLSQSERDEQRGYMDIFAGVMTGIRNPRVHEHNLEDEPDVALELIVLANHLMRMIDNASLNSE